VEGDSKDGVECLSIDMEKRLVVMKIGGIQTNVTFAPKDAPTQVASAAAAGQPNVRSVPPKTVFPNRGVAAANTTPGYPGVVSGSPVVLSSRKSSANDTGVTVAGSSFDAAAGAASGGPAYNAAATRLQQLNNSNTRVMPGAVSTRGFTTPSNARTVPTRPMPTQAEIQERLNALRPPNPNYAQ
jgi:hypothetical protein